MINSNSKNIFLPITNYDKILISLFKILEVAASYVSQKVTKFNKNGTPDMRDSSKTFRQRKQKYRWFT